MISINDINFYEVSDLTKLFDLSRQSVEKYLREGRIKGKKIKQRWLVTDEQLEQFLNKAENVN